jgi:hypothetical protein
MTKELSMDLFVMALTDKDADVGRAVKEIDLIKSKLKELLEIGIEIKKVFIKGREFVEIIELEYIKNNYKRTLESPRNEFYNLKYLQ